MKAYMKQLADLRNHASLSEVQEGDKVLVRQQKTNKLSPPFSTKSYEVTKRKGSLVTAQHGDHQVTRNVSCFKRVGNSCILPPTALPPVSENCNDNGLDDSTPHLRPGTPLLFGTPIVMSTLSLLPGAFLLLMSSASL